MANILPNGKQSISRRDFIKLSLLGLSGLGFIKFPLPQDAYEVPTNVIGRVTVDRVAPIFEESRFNSSIIRYTQKDELLNIYYELTPIEGPVYNPHWYRVWGGYIHSAYVQRTYIRFNDPLDKIPQNNQLAEVTVPFTQAFRYSNQDGWTKAYRLYYLTTHWITNIAEGPDGQAWYELTSEVDKYLKYYVPAHHLRPIPDEEISPISPELPYAAKHIEVSLSKQYLTAYEEDNIVYGTKISSGLPGREVPDGTQTPKGRFHITSKMPSKHMGTIEASGAPEGYSLPGVPWTSFFIFESGVAFHGTFWHDNFGMPMSHGCINMRTEDAKWLFRWVSPIYKTPIKSSEDWDVRGYGTQVIIH